MFASTESPERRADGRPVWWFDGRVARDGAVVLCAESLGASIREVRRESIRKIEIAAPRIAGERGWDEIAIDYERFWIWPAPKTGRTETSYTGYIMARVSGWSIDPE